MVFANTYTNTSKKSNMTKIILVQKYDKDIYDYKVFNRFLL